MTNCVSLWSSENRFNTGSPLFFSRGRFFGANFGRLLETLCPVKKVDFTQLRRRLKRLSLGIFRRKNYAYQTFYDM